MITDESTLGTKGKQFASAWRAAGPGLARARSTHLQLRGDRLLGALALLLKIVVILKDVCHFDVAVQNAGLQSNENLSSCSEERTCGRGASWRGIGNVNVIHSKRTMPTLGTRVPSRLLGLESTSNPPRTTIAYHDVLDDTAPIWLGEVLADVDTGLGLHDPRQRGVHLHRKPPQGRQLALEVLAMFREPRGGLAKRKGVSGQCENDV